MYTSNHILSNVLFVFSDKSVEPNTVLHLATQRLKMYHDFHSLTLQVEYYSEEMDDCKQCQPAK